MLILDVFNTVVALLIALALLCVAFALLSIRRLLARQLDLSRLANTQDAMKPPRGVEKTISNILSMEYQGQYEQAEVAKPEIIRLLNYLESLALGVRREILDEAVVREYFGPTMLKLFRMLRTPIYEMRSRYNSPAFIELESLVRKWETDGILPSDYVGSR